MDAILTRSVVSDRLADSNKADGLGSSHQGTSMQCRHDTPDHLAMIRTIEEEIHDDLR